MTRFQDQIALVTGAGRGIGASTAIQLAREGARVACISRTEEELQKVCHSAPGNLFPYVCDIGEEQEVASLFAKVAQDLGPLSILVNAAAVVTVQDFSQQSLQEWDRLYRINLRGTVACCLQAFPLMAAAAGGSIVNISSLGGLCNTEKLPGLSAYTTFKYAISGLTEALAVEGKSCEIRVNAVAPGAVNTKMLKEAAPFLKTSTEPEEVASVICFLCDSKQSGALNGIVLPIFSNE
jgi:NAD(P)-dependent dehydrogenase (short-subunit alcohol dehydrogenase family)